MVFYQVLKLFKSKLKCAKTHNRPTNKAKAKIKKPLARKPMSFLVAASIEFRRLPVSTSQALLIEFPLFTDHKVGP